MTARRTRGERQPAANPSGKHLIAFDLDGTLAESKQPLDDAMAALLARLSRVAEICIISGGDWPQFEKQVVTRLPADADRARFWIMPTTGTKLYRFGRGGWRCVFADLLTDAERAAVTDAVATAADRLGMREAKLWGPQIEDRGSQVTFSGLGQDAPLDAKDGWDPDRRKRKALQASLAKMLPELSVRIGGSTSIDITRRGIDKAYGMRRLIEESGISAGHILFLGDALYPGGNDAPVRETAGIDSIQVHSIGETARAVEAIIFCLGR